MSLTKAKITASPNFSLVGAINKDVQKERSHHFTGPQLKQHNQLTKANAIAEFIMAIGQGENAVTSVSGVIEMANQTIAQLIEPEETAYTINQDNKNN